MSKTSRRRGIRPFGLGFSGAALILALGASASGAASGATAKAAPLPTADAVYAKAITNAAAMTSVRERAVVTSSGYSSLGIDDASVDGARQVQTIVAGKLTFGFSSLLVGSKFFLNGDQSSLKSLFGYDALTAGLDAGHWLAIPTSSSSYGELSYGLNLGTAIEQLELAPPLAISGPMQYKKQSVYAITSNEGVHAGVGAAAVKGTFTLYVTATGRRLPVAEVARNVINGVTQVVTFDFSKWNEKLHFTVPAHTKTLT